MFRDYKLKQNTNCHGMETLQLKQQHFVFIRSSHSHITQSLKEEKTQDSFYAMICTIGRMVQPQDFFLPTHMISLALTAPSQARIQGLKSN